MAENSQKKHFKWKGFVSLSLGYTSLFVVASGILLYVSPRGRVANWGGWTLFGLTKEQWSGLHLAAALTILVIGVFHLYFNWKIFWNYIKDRRGFNLKYELAAATLLAVFIAVTAIWSLPPVSTLQDWNHSIKDYWEVREPEPPMPHAEELTLSELAELLGVTYEQAVSRLAEKGHEIPAGDLKVGEIAVLNDTTPEALGAAIRPRRGRGGGGHGSGDGGPGGGGSGGGVRGLGRISLGEFCQQAGLALDRVQAWLQEKGVDAAAADSFRDVAADVELTPRELYDQLAAEVK